MSLRLRPVHQIRVLLIKISRMRWAVTKLSMPYPVVEPLAIAWSVTVRAKNTCATKGRIFKAPKWLPRLRSMNSTQRVLFQA